MMQIQEVMRELLLQRQRSRDPQQRKRSRDPQQRRRRRRSAAQQMRGERSE
jgi:hypothetical protein